MVLIIKRIIDIITSISLLTISGPFFLIIPLLIKYDSLGPSFYLGVRAGKDNIPFKIIKFRTMDPNAENIGGTSTSHNDARITKLGQLLRRYKLDEIPQFINVLKGEMSIVGPRPEVYEYTTLYTDEEKEILSFRPGITDLASIEYFQLGEILGDDNADQVYRDQIRPLKNALRLKYVREHTLWMDFNIMFKTLLKFSEI
jgi:lipopolysaccharide/colanic/teichoic acid biosynthesis glycosyltransferase